VKTKESELNGSEDSLKLCEKYVLWKVGKQQEEQE
jgi:hypothetical protein